jgi:hypothetical protein
MRSQETHAAAQGSRSTRKDLNMKAKIWVLCTLLADENAPAMPAVFASETEAWAKYDEMIRAEWDSTMDSNDDGPCPGDPDEAQNRIRQAHGAEWSRWELTRHDVELSATK